jgi:hypothetical protein
LPILCQGFPHLAINAMLHHPGLRCPVSSLPQHLVHRKDGPEPYISAFHVFNGFLNLIHWEFLNHAFDTLVFGEANGLLAVQRMARRPSIDSDTLADHGHGIYGYLTDGFIRGEVSIL